jgi:hypothetical protein
MTEDQRLDEREKQQHSEDELVRRGRECNKSAGSQSTDRKADEHSDAIEKRGTFIVRIEDCRG